MKRLSPNVVWNLNDGELLSLLNTDTLTENLQKIHFYAPSFTYYRTKHYHSSPLDFPTISVTGSYCALKCKHCGGKVLDTMIPATTPKNLFEVAVKLKQTEAKGCLISGGCQLEGTIPLKKFIATIKKIKRELEFTIFVHTGIINVHTALKLKDAGVDAALIDVIGSNETIREIYNSNLTVKAYEKSLVALHRSGINFVPHVIIGLHYGQLRGELYALKVIRNSNPSAVVLIAFMPIHGTKAERVKPPQPIEIAKVIAAARVMFLKKPLAFGCMRPKGRDRKFTEILAMKAGINAIAFPTDGAIQYAKERGYKTIFSSFCCAQIYSDFTDS